MDELDSVHVVQGILEAFGSRDNERLVSYMAEDVVLEPSAFISGKGTYEGHAEIVEGVDELDRELGAQGTRVKLHGFKHYVESGDPETVLSLGFVTITRSSGDEFGTPIAYLWSLRNGKVERLRTWLDHAEGLAQIDEAVLVVPPDGD